tara:strand:+ start:412 stop:693 length:282 start_codon:yes stop_codon:yes gene_type:complete
MKTINKNKAKELIYKSNGSIFSSLFIKKNGEHRLLTGRTKVKKYLKDNPKPPPFEPSKYNLIRVFDMQKEDYRMINLNTLIKLNINKTKYIIK